MKIFDDWYSALHFLLGLVAGLADNFATVAITMVYIAYQLFEREHSNAKLGDYIEYTIGLVLGSLLSIFHSPLQP